MVSRSTIFGLRRNRPSSEVRAEMRTLQRDLQKVRTDVRDLAHALYEAGRDGADSATTQFRDRMQRISGAYQTARRRGDQAVGSVVDTIGERPMTSMLTAIAAGFVLAGLAAMASLLMRRSS